MTNALKIFLPTIISFIVGIILTPIATHYFYKYKLWRKVSRKENIPDDKKNNFEKVHNEKSELSTPRVGGIIIWGSVILTLFVILTINFLFDNMITNKLYFISRNQTFIPLFTLIFASLVGLGDDFLQIFAKGK
jgi:phospho-N-acetylmuramoyl-pentapeptide-transferase